MPDETTIYCSRCSAYNIGSDCCICKSCLNKLIDEWKNKIIEKTKKRIPEAEYYDIYDEDFEELKEELNIGGSA